jgi:hypothetical protein
MQRCSRILRHVNAAFKGKKEPEMAHAEHYEQFRGGGGLLVNVVF